MVGATCIGDGATSTGAVHEAINQAAVEKLPLVLIVADNQYAYSTPLRANLPAATWRPGRRLRRGIPFRGWHGFVRLPEGCG